MDQRKEELERKKKRLEELRKTRDERQSELIKLKSLTRQTEERFREKRQDVDSLVNELLNVSPSLHNNDINPSSLNIPSSSSPSPVPPTSSSGTSALVGQESELKIDPLRAQASTSNSRPTYTLQEADIVFLDLPPKERIVYSKETQTDSISPHSPTLIPPTPTATTMQTPTPPSPLPPLPSEVEEKVQESPIEPVSKCLSEEEKKSIWTSDTFLHFLHSSSHAMEKALAIAEQFDFLKDYSSHLHASGLANEIHAAKLLNMFYCEKYTEGRTVTSIQWNPQFPELFFVAYSKSNRPTTQSDGLVLVWNMVLPSTPEFVLTCQSEVTAGVISPFHANLIAAGTYSGQVVVWDTQLPVMKPMFKTPLSHAGHTHPITCAAIIGTATVHHLITSSNDGCVCFWSLDVMSHPTETLFLCSSTSNATSSATSTTFPSTAPSLYANELGVTCFAFAVNETTHFYVGTDDGKVMQVQRYDRPGSPSGVVMQWQAHRTCVTQLVCHPSHAVGAFDFSGLLLTCSMDWTIKVWKHAKCIAQFDVNHDYVLDVQWSPSHPAVFVSCNASGCVDLYNLNLDTEMYVARIKVPTSHSSSSSSASVSTSPTNTIGLNKVCFDKEGKRLASGTSDGKVFIYEVDERFLPHEDDRATFQKTITQLEFMNEKKKVDMEA